MLSYSDYFSPQICRRTFFAGANTPSGFYGEYKNLLSEDTFEKIYIVKGGSGTGKSTLIRRGAEGGIKVGGEVTYLLCSSDPESLDGVIIEKEEKKIAIIDGTAPHTQDPVYAGACGEILNCGDYWNSTVLEKNKEEISSIINEKNGVYRRAYRFLGAALEVVEMQQTLASYCLEEDKIKKAVSRLCEPFGRNRKKGSVTYRRTLAVSMKGAVRLTSFEEAQDLCSVADCAFISPIFYKLLLEELLSCGFDVTVSLSPVYGIAELYIPELCTAFVPHREGVEYKKCVNLRRFANKEKMAEVKQKRIFTSKCLSSMMEGAAESLSEAAVLHFRLENIYKGTMDFKGLDTLGDALSESIVKRLS